MSAMEAMLKTVIRSMNIDPDALMASAQQFINGVHKKIVEFDARLTANEKLLAEILQEVKRRNQNDAEKQSPDTTAVIWGNGAIPGSGPTYSDGVRTIIPPNADSATGV